MDRIIMRELALASVFAVLTSVIYRFWLTYPILRVITVGQWRILAILAAGILGAAAGLVRLRSYFFVLAVAAGLSLGGAWAGLSAPHDVATSFLGEFASHLRIFGREVALLTFASTMTNFVCARLLSPNRGVA
jgi:hypothetical protein